MRAVHLNSHGWLLAEDAELDKWYIAIYFNDRTPYIVKKDKNLWRDSGFNPVAVPLRVKPVGPLPVLNKAEKSSEDKD